MKLKDRFEDLPSSKIDPPAKLDKAIWESFEPYLFDYLKNHFNTSTPIYPQAVIWDDWNGEDRQAPWLSVTRDIAPLAKEKGWTLLGKYDHHRDFPGLKRVIDSYTSKYIGEYGQRYQIDELKSAIEAQKKTTPNARVIGVLFTGGADSTSLVLDNLEDTIVNLSDIEGRLALKVLAVLPHVRLRQREALDRIGSVFEQIDIVPRDELVGSPVEYRRAIHNRHVTLVHEIVVPRVVELASWIRAEVPV